MRRAGDYETGYVPQFDWRRQDFPVLISPDGVSQFRVVKQLVASDTSG
jgi:hypothetical protein